jgi:hypothetical protein
VARQFGYLILNYLLSLQLLLVIEAGADGNTTLFNGVLSVLIAQLI